MAKNISQYQKARNARRKAQRRINALEKQLTTAGNHNTREKLKGRIKELTKAVEETRTYSSETGKRVRTASDVAANINRLEKLNKDFSYLTTSQTRSNKAVEVEINRASVGVESMYTETQVKVFYRATQKAWQNRPIAERNKAILDYYGEKSLKKVFEDVVSNEQNSNVQKAIDILQNGSEATDDEKAWALEQLQDNDDLLRYTVVPSGVASEDVSPVAPM